MSKSGLYGVYFHKASGKWAAQIRNGGKVEYLGVFARKIHAARAYDRRARVLGKKRLNFVDPIDYEITTDIF